MEATCQNEEILIKSGKKDICAYDPKERECCELLFNYKIQ